MSPFLGNELMQGDLVVLSRPTKEDIATFARWSHDIGYQRNLRRSMVYPGDAADYEGWIGGLIEKEEGTPFAVRRLDDDHLVGFVMLTDIYQQARHAMVIIGFDPAQQGRGYGTDAMRVILRFAFFEMNLNRVGLEVMAYNTGARRVYEKVGFKLEGTRRSVVFRDGVFYDIHLMGILRSEWEALTGSSPIRYQPSGE